jgi:hypothetical protein
MRILTYKLEKREMKINICENKRWTKKSTEAEGDKF